MSNDNKNFETISTKTALAIIFVAAISRLLSLGAYPLMDPTEARYAEIARKMVATGDFITPYYYGGVPFWGKPPLSFWLTSLSYKAFGVSEFSARLPSFLLAIFIVFMIYRFALHFYGQRTALMSALILSTTALFYTLAGAVVTDTALAFCTTLSMISLPMALDAQDESRSRLWGLLFFIGAGLSLLAKGPIGLVLIVFPITVWALWTRRLREVFKRLPWVPGIIIALAIAIPWYVIAEMKTPGFFEYFFIGEHWKRFVEPGWAGDLYGDAHDQPHGMIWLLFLADSFPWIIFIAAGCVWLRSRGRRLKDAFNDKWAAYLLCMALAPMVFFTMAGNVLMTYVLPGLPAFAVLTAVTLSAARRADVARLPWFLKPATLLAVAVFTPAAFVIGLFTVLPSMDVTMSQKQLVESFDRQKPDDGAKLVYIVKVPFSADFYTSGRVEKMKDMTLDSLNSEFADGETDFFAVRKEKAEKFADAARDNVSRLSEYGNYVLYREENSHAPSSAFKIP